MQNLLRNKNEHKTKIVIHKDYLLFITPQFLVSNIELSFLFAASPSPRLSFPIPPAHIFGLQVALSGPDIISSSLKLFENISREMFTFF